MDTAAQSYDPLPAIDILTDDFAREGWEAQDYAGQRTVLCADSHPAGAFNPAVRAGCGDLLVVASGGVHPLPGFLSFVSRFWDACDALVCDAALNGVPHHPLHRRVLVLKRWVYTRLRGLDGEGLEGLLPRLMSLGRGGAVRIGDFPVGLIGVDPDGDKRSRFNQPASFDAESPRFSVITVCMGRWHHLRVSLETWRSVYPDVELVVVVAGPGDEHEALFSSFPWPGRLVRVSTPVYRAGYLRNIGARLSSGDMLGFIDADVSMRGDWPATCSALLADAELALSSLLYHGYDAGGLSGTHAVQRWVFEKVRGYNENLDGAWGYEDTDFYLRAQRAGARVAAYPFETLRHVDHSDADRVRYQLRADVRSQDLLREKIAMCRRDDAVHPYEANRDVRLVFPDNQIEVFNLEASNAGCAAESS